jgi:hypothetical protein
VTEQYEENLGPDIDIWCPDEPMFSDSLPWPPYPEVYEDLRAEGKKTWWYNCVSANIGFDYANHMVDQESTYMRTWLWLTRRYGFTGILFGVSSIFGPPNVWEDMYAERFASRRRTRSIRRARGNRRHDGHPDSSLRIKALREAMRIRILPHLESARFSLGGQCPEPWAEDFCGNTIRGHSDWRPQGGRKILGTLD